MFNSNHFFHLFVKECKRSIVALINVQEIYPLFDAVEGKKILYKKISKYILIV